MGTLAEAGREFWRGVLQAGGAPRSRGGPPIRCRASGCTRSRFPTRWRRRWTDWRDELRVPVDSMLLAAHAKVLAALSGEREVALGYVAAAGGDPLPCRVVIAAAVVAGIAAGCALL